jgi:tetratricopeptide (TPR) repeat protein
LNAAYADALSQLVSIAFAENMPDRALERVQQQIQLAPNSAQLYEVLGGVHLARKEAEQAEAAYSKAIELEPKSSFTAYLALAQIYGRAKRHDEALAELDQVLKANPKNFGALMLTGEIQKARGDVPKAQAAYEKIIAVDPRFGPAANNLAYLYSEHGGDKEKALALAQTAKEAMPEDPRVSDTLGWILYKRGLYGGAVRLLTESAAKRPDDAEVQFHLGMAQYKMRNADAAKRALARALELNASFAGREEARQTLSELR